MGINMPVAAPSEQFLKSLFPYFTVFFFIVLGLLVWPNAFLSKLFMHLPLLVVCYWAVNRPDLFGKRGAFLAGLAQDLLQGHMLGLMAFSYLAADAFLRTRHDEFARRPFLINWAFYAGVSVATMLLQWLFAQIFMGQTLAPLPLFLALLPALLVFPLLHFILYGLQRTFL